MKNARARPAQNYSRAYLHHLIKSQEMLGPMLLTWHNLTYYQQLMAGMRDSIDAGSFADFEAKFHETRAQGDIPAL